MASVLKKIKYYSLMNIRRLVSKNKGVNNEINIGKNVSIKYSIKGSNNKLDVTQSKDSYKNPCKIDVKIFGENNAVVVKNANHVCNLKIFIGNFFPINNCEIVIDEGVTIVDMNVLGYSNNSALTIGKECLFSKNIQIRMGESPHIIVDKLTGENLDKGANISIGNHCWIGENVCIMKNASIEANNIVGMGAVVTRKFNNQYTVIAGNPAQVKKENVDWKES